MLDTRLHGATTTGFAWRPVPFTDVTITDRFWAPRLQRNRTQTIPYQYRQCKDTGRIDALRLTWKPGIEPVPHIFWDSDVAKWIEAASYSLATNPDPALDAQVDEAIALLAAAQQPDGYLNTYFTVVQPGERWTDLRHAHELYCAGHLIEAGVAHFQATGKRSLLDVVCRYADHIDSVFGTQPGQKRGYCGHEEIELALVKLYRATGQQRYLLLAQYFVDERGRQPFYFDQEEAARTTPGYFSSHFTGSSLRSSREYGQAHKPVREQTEVVGHAVRAMYLYSAMADLAGETADSSLRHACDRLWQHLCGKRLYITGGIGSAKENEGFSGDYDLPNEAAYAETCAAIGLVFWAHRMAQLDGDACFIDVLEQALYNGVISGVSHDGTRFFYANPLASTGNVTRAEWFGVACCPPNLARLLASLGQYVYSTNESAVAVQLYIQGSVQCTLAGRQVTLQQQTDYPWDGTVTIALAVEEPTTLALHLRVPGWCREATLSVNGEPIDLPGCTTRGYARIERLWQNGDRVQLVLAMPAERIHAHPAVRSTAGMVALQRGPLVYCLEGADNPVPLQTLVLPPLAPLTTRLDDTLLGGVVLIDATAAIEQPAGWNGTLYRHDRMETTPFQLTALPYFAWDNRTPGEMRVWLREGAATAE